MRKYFNKEEIKYLVRERKLGKTIKEISKALGRSINSVKTKYRNIQKKILEPLE